MRTVAPDSGCRPQSQYTQELLKERLADELPDDVSTPIYQEGQQQ
jgi:hypothetical protein